MNIHQRGQKVLNRGRKSTAVSGVSVLYTRGGTTVPLVVTPTTPDPDTSTQPSSTGRNADKERFYTIVLAVLTAAGLGEPEEGDRITEVLNGVSCVFEVTPRRTEQAEQWNTQRDRVRVRCIPRKLA